MPTERPNLDATSMRFKQRVAQELDLPYVNDGIQIPDARIEYELDLKNNDGLDQGSSHADIEVLTAACRPGHLARTRASRS